MREIEFRGLRVDGKGWVYGSLIKTYTGRCFIQATLDICLSETVFEAIEVIPETVGQYTGLKDKNGKKIFEGDEILWKYMAMEEDTGATDEVEGDGVVVYHDDCFCVDSDVDGFTGMCGITGLPGNIKVIGNIHQSELKE